MKEQIIAVVLEECERSLESTLSWLATQSAALESEITGLQAAESDKARQQAEFNSSIETRNEWIKTALVTNLQLLQQTTKINEGLQARKLELKVNLPIFNALIQIINLLELTADNPIFSEFLNESTRVASTLNYNVTNDSPRRGVANPMRMSSPSSDADGFSLVPAFASNTEDAFAEIASERKQKGLSLIS